MKSVIVNLLNAIDKADFFSVIKSTEVSEDQ